jgi:presenilin-like A22 family membrane protease
MAKKVQLSYADLCGPDTTTTGRHASTMDQWFRDEFWWLVALCCFTTLFILSELRDFEEVHFLAYLPLVWCQYFSYLPVMSILLVLIAGREVKSWWVLAVPLSLLFLALEIWWVDDWLSQ